VKTEHEYFASVPAERPDFRVVLAFAWGDDVDCDTDGDARHPASRDWTFLYAERRDGSCARFEIEMVQELPATMAVRSPSRALAASLVAFLAEETGGVVAKVLGGPFVPAESLKPDIGGFDFIGAVARAAASRYRRATIANPYPS
jgi:hypothetical protein